MTALHVSCMYHVWVVTSLLHTRSSPAHTFPGTVPGPWDWTPGSLAGAGGGAGEVTQHAAVNTELIGARDLLLLLLLQLVGEL